MSATVARPERFVGFASALVCWLYLPQIASAFAAYSSFVRGVLPPPPQPGNTTSANSATKDARLTGTTVPSVADARLRVHADEPLRRRRLAVLLRLPLVVPHYIVLSVWTFLAAPAVAVAWLALLIEGRLPTWLHRFLAAFVRYQGQVAAWFDLLSARYPDPLHTADHPFRIELPERPRQRRLVTLFRLPLAVPVIVLGSVLSVVLSTVAIPAWFAGVIFGRNTAGLQELGTFCLRYQLEVQAYVMLVTPAYPRLAPPEVTTTEPG